MKKYAFSVVLVLLITVLCIPVFSHSGGTDSKGGHRDSSTGEYHYHHGMPAHQHPNGVCPYSKPGTTQTPNYKDNESNAEIPSIEIESIQKQENKTQTTSNPNETENKKTKQESGTTTAEYVIGSIIALGSLALAIYFIKDGEYFASIGAIGMAVCLIILMILGG